MPWVLPVGWDGKEASCCELSMTLKLAEAINVPQGYPVWTGLGCPCKLEAESWGHSWQGSEKGSAWEL